MGAVSGAESVKLSPLGAGINFQGEWRKKLFFVRCINRRTTAQRWGRSAARSGSRSDAAGASAAADQDLPDCDRRTRPAPTVYRTQLKWPFGTKVAVSDTAVSSFTPSRTRGIVALLPQPADVLPRARPRWWDSLRSAHPTVRNGVESVPYRWRVERNATEGVPYRWRAPYGTPQRALPTGVGRQSWPYARCLAIL